MRIFRNLFLRVCKWSMGVRVINERETDETIGRVYASLEKVASRAGLCRVPDFGIFASPDASAFATGPSAAKVLVAVSTGLIENKSAAEVEGVLAYEVAHVKNGHLITLPLVREVLAALFDRLPRPYARRH